MKAKNSVYLPCLWIAKLVFLYKIEEIFDLKAGLLYDQCADRTGSIFNAIWGSKHCL
jgi:hypothetical protein